MTNGQKRTIPISVLLALPFYTTREALLVVTSQSMIMCMSEDYLLVAEILYRKKKKLVVHARRKQKGFVLAIFYSVYK